MKIPGLPESIEVVAYRRATSEDFTMVGVTAAGKPIIRQGGGSGAEFIIEPAAGFSFNYMIATDTFTVASVVSTKTSGMNFSEAVAMARCGKTIARPFWEGASICLAPGNLPHMSVIHANGQVDRYDPANGGADFMANDWLVTGEIPAL